MFDDFTTEIQSDELAEMMCFFEEVLEDDDQDFDPDEDDILNYSFNLKEE